MLLQWKHPPAQNKIQERKHHRAEGEGQSSQNMIGAGRSVAVSMVTMLHAECKLTILSLAPDESKLQIIIVLTHEEYFYKIFLLFLKKFFYKKFCAWCPEK